MILPILLENLRRTKRLAILLSFTCSGCLLCGIAKAQRNGTSIADTLALWVKKYPKEQLYVHTNQSVFSAGDTLWYKVYASSAVMPVKTDEVVYLQLIDKKGKIINENKLLLKGGSACGDMDVPSALPAGIYSLRAFTSWMLNFDEDYIFHKNIYVIDVRNNAIGACTNNTVTNYQVAFFPEGGDLVNSLTSKVAFKVTNNNGLPVPVSGKIMDNDHPIMDIRSIHDGMGFFYLQPAAGHIYTAVIYFPDGSDKKIALPVSKPEGYVLSLRAINARSVDIGVTHKTMEPPVNDSITLVAAQSTGKVISYTVELDNGSNVIAVPKNDFQAGIVRITLFDRNGLPQAERLLFIQQPNDLSLQMRTDTLSLLPKGKSAFTFKILRGGEAIPNGNFSISVIDAGLKDTLAGNIFSTLLLTNELKGYIHAPNYYFQNNDTATAGKLDLVLLTNGWRRFAWKQLLEAQPLVLKYYPENSLNLLGRISNYAPGSFKNKQPFSILIQNADSSKYMGYIEPDSSGNFCLKDYNVYGNAIVYFKNTDARKKNSQKPQMQFYSTSVDSVRTAPYFTLPEPAFSDTVLSSFVPKSDNKDTMVLAPVTVEAYLSKTKKLAGEYVSPLFASDRFYDFDFVNNFYPNSIPIIDFMKGRFPGLVITGDFATGYAFSYRNSAQNALRDTSARQPYLSTSGSNMPYFYLNETLTTLNMIESIQLSDVALIRFNPPPFPAAPMNGGFLGAICVYTKKGVAVSADETSMADHYKQYVFKGFSISRQFYSPDYDQVADKDSIQDNRTTLYWNPNVSFDEKGNFRFSFYNSDHVKKFYIQVTGVTNNGALLYYEKELTP